jgi:hypothetical protein
LARVFGENGAQRVLDNLLDGMVFVALDLKTPRFYGKTNLK